MQLDTSPFHTLSSFLLNVTDKSNRNDIGDNSQKATWSFETENGSQTSNDSDEFQKFKDFKTTDILPGWYDRKTQTWLTDVQLNLTNSLSDSNFDNNEMKNSENFIPKGWNQRITSEYVNSSLSSDKLSDIINDIIDDNITNDSIGICKPTNDIIEENNENRFIFYCQSLLKDKFVNLVCDIKNGVDCLKQSNNMINNDISFLNKNIELKERKFTELDNRLCISCRNNNPDELVFPKFDLYTFSKNLSTITPSFEKRNLLCSLSKCFFNDNKCTFENGSFNRTDNDSISINDDNNILIKNESFNRKISNSTSNNITDISPRYNSSYRNKFYLDCSSVTSDSIQKMFSNWSVIPNNLSDSPTNLGIFPFEGFNGNEQNSTFSADESDNLTGIDQQVLEKMIYDYSFLFLTMFILAGGVGNILVCLAVSNLNFIILKFSI